jgi:hypothetical protein
MAETPKDWVTLQPNLDFIMVVPNAIIQTIDSVLAFVITLLNIANTVLNVIKVFLVGLLDPIRAIVEAIIEEIRAFIHDLRQMGLYMTGDWNLITIKPLRAPELLGGFQSYERRMLKRLLNRRDPGRPDFSSRSVALGLFCYLSTGDLFALIELINRIKAFFGDRSATGPAPFPQPTPPEATLGTYGLSTALFKKPDGLDTAPDAVTLKWTMPGTGGLFSKPPGGFLVHISTMPNGFGLRSFRWEDTGGPEDSEETESGAPTVKYWPAVGIEAQTGTELRLFGGVSDLATEEDGYTDVERDKAQANRLLLSLDQNTPLIPPSKLIGSGSIPIGAATYYLKLPKFNKVAPMQAYSTTIKYSDLPQMFTVEADGSTSGGLPKVKLVTEDCYTFYARVRPVTDAYVEALSAVDGTPDAPAVIPADACKLITWGTEAIKGNSKALFSPRPGPPAATGSEQPSPQEIGQASAPTVFSMPSATMLDFITATQVALEVLLLVRADYTLVDSNVVEEETIINGAVKTYSDGYQTGLESLKDFLTTMKVKDEFYTASTDSKKFRRRVKQKSAWILDRFFSQPPPESIAEALAEDVANLLDFKWTEISSSLPDMTILETVASQDPNQGLAASPIGIGTPEIKRRLRLGSGSTEGMWPDRSGIFPERFTASGGTYPELYAKRGWSETAFLMGDGYCDTTPVVFKATNMSMASVGRYDLKAQFVRKLLLEWESGKILNSASAILAVVGAANAKSPSESDWKTIRFFDEALAPLDKLMVEVEAFLLAILDGLQGLIDKIIAYIEAIQARIYQIQALIEMIRALLNSLTMFDLPSFSGLLLVENGTDGITKGLVTAGNKPSDSPMSYGGGVLVMTGGLPAIILEIIEMILGGGASE